MTEELSFSFPKATRYRRFDGLGLMIDFETLGVGANCALLHFGAILFNMPDTTFKEPGVVPDYVIDVPHDNADVFFHTFDLRSQVFKDKRVIEPDSLTWWVKNPMFREMLHQSMDRSRAQTIQDFLQNFRTFYNAYSRPEYPLTIYAKGTNFDVSILEALCRNNGMEPFWRYNSIVDVRTFCKAAGLKALVAPDDMAHDALVDCLYQIESVRRAAYFIQIGGTAGMMERSTLDLAFKSVANSFNAIKDAPHRQTLTFGQEMIG